MEKTLRQSNLWMFLCLLLLAVLACQKDEPQHTSKETVLGPELSKAKQWFEQSSDAAWLSGKASRTDMVKAVTDNNSVRSNGTIGEPQWADAWVGVDGVVEVPLAQSGKQAYSSNPNTTEAELDVQLTRLLVLKNRQGKNFSVLMHIMGNADYLQKSGYNLKSNRYKKMAPDFSGTIFYTYLDGSFCYGWKFENGKITNAIKTITSSTEKRPIRSSCVTHYYAVYTCYCVYVSGIEPNCSDWTLSHYVSWNECVYDGNDGGYYDDGGGGGGVPSNTPPPNPIDPCTAIDSLKNDTGFESRISQFYETALNDRLEDGYRLMANGEQLRANREEGKVTYTFYTGTKFSEAIHTHNSFDGGSPNISAADIRMLYNLWKKDRMVDPNTFRYGVVSSYGFMMVQISDFQAFEDFIHEYDIVENPHKLDLILMSLPKLNNSLEDVLGRYARFMGVENCGLTFMFRERNDDGTDDPWQVMEAESGNLSITGCE